MLDMSIAAKAKSDQLNAADLIGHEITVTVSRVSLGADNKATINYEGDNGRPFKPCVSMVRLLNHAWGNNGNNWVGRSMTLFCDPTVVYAGEAVGGVRISGLSHIDRDFTLVLPISRNKRKPYSVKKIAISEPVKPEFYPDEVFDKNWTQTLASIQEKGESQKQVLIDHFTKTAPLTKKQMDAINNIEIPTNEVETIEEKDVF